MQFRLYIAGQSPNSVLAITNLKAICEEFCPNPHQIEIVDIPEELNEPIQGEVLLTATSIRVSPTPGVRLVGDLSERGKVLNALGISHVV